MLYNFRTQQYEDPPEELDDYSDYIPQHGPAQNLYRRHRQTGDTPRDAAHKVLFGVVTANDSPAAGMGTEKP